jgi:Fic family protein
MQDEDDIVRHSRAAEAVLIADPDARARQEAQNSLLQAARVDDYILSGIDGSRSFKLRISTLLDLNRIAIAGINAYAGNFRPGDVEIGKSKHRPPGAHLVPELVEMLCEYVNENWSKRTAVHLAAYVLWRINWIHPFSDGNGRTARAASYLVLCIHERLMLPGGNTIPEQIIQRRAEYYGALEAADNIDADNSVNETDNNPVEKLEELLTDMLAEQLLSSLSNATGNPIM